MYNTSESTTMVFDTMNKLHESTSEILKRLSQEVDAAFINPQPNNSK